MEPSSDAELIIRKHIGDMQFDEIESMLLRIRERRLRAVKMYEAAKALAEAQLEDKLREGVAKQARMLKKELDRLDTVIGKVEDRIVKVCALAIQLGDELPGWQDYFNRKETTNES